MRKRNFRYYCRMVVKTTLCLLPLLILLFVCFGSNFKMVLSSSDYVMSPYFSFLQGFLEDLYYCPINSWYQSVLEAFTLDDAFGSQLSTILLTLPLYYIWVEIFDLLLHLIFFFTDLFHKFLGAEK